MLPLLAPILSQLAGAGMQKVADAVMDKGLDVVEAKLGVKLTPNEDGVLDSVGFIFSSLHALFVLSQGVICLGHIAQRLLNPFLANHSSLIHKNITAPENHTTGASAKPRIKL